jgi:hypothetical protein
MLARHRRRGRHRGGPGRLMPLLLLPLHWLPLRA